jgi:hypothetical protein
MAKKIIPVPAICLPAFMDTPPPAKKNGRNERKWTHDLLPQDYLLALLGPENE